MSRRADEILILRRFSGYLRLHIPPLIYSPKASLLVQKKLLAFDGVRKVDIKKELGKISVHYDPIVVPEKGLLLAIDEVASPLLRHEEQESYERVVTDIERARQKRLMRKAVVAVILIYLLRIHWRLLTQRWLRDPVNHLPTLLAIATLIYIHRKHIKEVPSFD